MKQLLLLRHAKSSWATETMPDRQRPLAPRGEAAGTRMGEEIAARRLLPDLILCSPAMRTRQTLERLKPSFGGATRFDFVDDLYEAPEATYIDIIRAHGGDAGRLLVIGHNPHTHATAVTLAGDGEPTLRVRLASGFPTAALAVIGFSDGPWKSIAPGKGRLETFVRPRDIMAGSDDD